MGWRQKLTGTDRGNGGRFVSPSGLYSLICPAEWRVEVDDNIKGGTLTAGSFTLRPSERVRGLVKQRLHTASLSAAACSR